MIFNRYLATLKGTFLFMSSFGLLMGFVFPFYSYLFFGTRAFTPLYAIGCLAAGFLVGTFCYAVIKQVLKLSLQRQVAELSSIVGVEPEALLNRKGDQLQATMDLQALLMEKVETLVTSVTAGLGRIGPLYRQLDEASQELLQGNGEQVDRVRKTVSAAQKMNAAFSGMLREVEEISHRAEERTSLSAQMSAATDAIAERVDQYSSSLLETSASIEEIAASIREISQNTEDLAVSTEQAAGSITEISASIAQVRDNAQKTTETSRKVRLQAREGLDAMASLLGAMQQIEASSQASVAAIQRLGQHTARIGSFLNIITEIVEQTNLLSLNASIIAAQAGEKGRAFAVVAEEVRSLAQRTASSTREISGLVENIQRETAEVERTIIQGTRTVSEGARISGKTDAALRLIEESAAEASAMVQKIAQATVEQASGSNLIAQEGEKNLARVKKVRLAILEQEKRTQQIVQALEQMSSLARQINRSTSEQAQGNRQYLDSVVGDNEKAQGLKEAAIQQMILGDQVLTVVQEAGTLIEANAEKAKGILREIETLTRLTGRLNDELTSFRNRPAPTGLQGR